MSASKKNLKRKNSLNIYLESRMNDEKAKIDPEIVKLMINNNAN
jgi:hypothetical protein